MKTKSRNNEKKNPKSFFGNRNVQFTLRAHIIIHKIIHKINNIYIRMRLSLPTISPPALSFDYYFNINYRLFFGLIYYVSLHAPWFSIYKFIFHSENGFNSKLPNLKFTIRMIFEEKKLKFKINKNK